MLARYRPLPVRQGLRGCWPHYPPYTHIYIYIYSNNKRECRPPPFRKLQICIRYIRNPLLFQRKFGRRIQMDHSGLVETCRKYTLLHPLTGLAKPQKQIRQKKSAEKKYEINENVSSY